MKKCRNKITTSFLFGIALILWGCGGGGSSPSEFAGTTITLSKKAGIPAEGTAPANIDIRLANENGDPISGRTVTISATGEGNDITQPTQATDADGQASAQLRSDEPGIKTISVNISQGEDEPLTLDVTASVHFGNRFGDVAISNTGGGNNGLALGDLDLDGAADIATASSNSNNVSVLFGKLLGATAFTFARLDTDNVGADPSDVASGDIDGDGDLDLMVTNATDGTVSILTNNGFGLFEDQVENEAMEMAYPTVTTGANPIGIISADFNLDGFADFATVNDNADADAQLTVALADGAGDFGTPTNLAAGTGPSDIVMGDLNLDGAMDFVVVNGGEDTVSAYTNDGAGAFSQSDTVATSAGASKAALGDIDEDGNLDLIVTTDVAAVDDTPAEYLNRFRGNGDGTFLAVVIVPGPTATPSGVHLADVDGDFSLDLLYTQGGNLNFQSGDGTGVFEADADSFGTSGGNPDNIITGDFNNDTFVDVVVERDNSIGYFTLPRDTE